MAGFSPTCLWRTSRISRFVPSPDTASRTIQRAPSFSAIASPVPFLGDQGRSIPPAYTATGIAAGLKTSRPRSPAPGQVLSPPRLLVPDPALRLALPVGDVVPRDRNRGLRHVVDREVAEVPAQAHEPLLRVHERREEGLPGAAQEADVLPLVHPLAPFQELRDLHLRRVVPALHVRHDVPHALPGLHGEPAIFQLTEGRDRGGEDDVLVEGLRRALREDELPEGDRVVEDPLRDDPEDVHRLRDAFMELRGGARLAEDAEHRLLRGVDEPRRIVPPELDPAELELPVLQKAVVPVQRPDARRLAWEERNPLVPALELDCQARGARDVVDYETYWIRILVGPEPDGVHDAVHDIVAMALRDFHRTDEEVPRNRVDRLVALDSAITCILVPSKSETCDQKPLQNRVAVAIHFLERPGLFLHFLVVSPSLENRPQDPWNQSDSTRAEMVSQSGHRDGVRAAARAVQALRRDIVLHHDARI